MSLVNLLVGVVGWLGLLLVMAVSMTLAAIGTNCGRRSSATRVPPLSRSSATARRSRYTEAAASASRGYRLDRLRQASFFAAAGYVTFLMAAALTAAGVSFALALSFWAMLAAGAGYPLL